MQLSSPHIQNGSSLRINVTFSPPLGNERFSRFGLAFGQVFIGIVIPKTSILLWNRTIDRISFHKNLPASEKARMHIVSTHNPTSLDISSITFADDNRLLVTFVEYNDSIGINATNEKKTVSSDTRIKVYSKLLSSHFRYNFPPSVGSLTD